MTENRELDLNELEGVLGGVGNCKPPKAYCRKCREELLFLKYDHIGGCSTAIYYCVNPSCPEEGKDKNNLEVNFTK